MEKRASESTMAAASGCRPRRIRCCWCYVCGGCDDGCKILLIFFPLILPSVHRESAVWGSYVVRRLLLLLPLLFLLLSSSVLSLSCLEAVQTSTAFDLSCFVRSVQGKGEKLCSPGTYLNGSGLLWCSVEDDCSLDCQHCATSKR